MSKFFINRPIVAMVISIVMVIVGIVAMVQLPIAQFPELAPPEILLNATYVGADALTLEQSVATPIEQQLQGVDNMIYMNSINSSSGLMRLRVDFDVGTDANTDQILTQMRYLQAESQLPTDVRNQGVTILKSATSPLALFSLYPPKGTYDGAFLANYAYININDPMSRVPGIGQVAIFGADKYAMRFWVRPDTLASLGITVSDITAALSNQNTVNPAGQIGAEPVPRGQEFTYTVRAQGRLLSAEDFGNIVVRANPDGSIVRMTDVARVELGAQKYNQIGRLNGNPAAIIAIYQLPGSNAIETVNGAKQLMEDLKRRFPQDLDYTVSLDTTLAVTEGIREIVKTLVEALALVIIVAFVGGIQGRLNNQFAVTIAISTLISAFNALTLSPALSALLLRPRKESRGLLGRFFDGFNRGFGKVMHGYLVGSDALLHKAAFSVVLLLVIALSAGLLGSRLPRAFLPEEDQGYFYMNIQLPTAASLQRTDNVAKQIEGILKETPGVQTYNTVVGFSLLSFNNTTYNAFYFVTLKPWDERDAQGLTADVIIRRLNQRLAGLPEAQAFAFAPPAIPGIGTSGGATFMLEDRSGQDIAFLAQNTDRFLQAARQRPEFASLTTTIIPPPPQGFADLDRDKVLT